MCLKKIVHNFDIISREIITKKVADDIEDKGVDCDDKGADVEGELFKTFKNSCYWTIFPAISLKEII